MRIEAPEGEGKREQAAEFYGFRADESRYGLSIRDGRYNLLRPWSRSSVSDPCGSTPSPSSASASSAGRSAWRPGTVGSPGGWSASAAIAVGSTLHGRPGSSQTPRQTSASG